VVLDTRDSVSFCVDESMEETGLSFALDSDQERNLLRLYIIWMF
jgi:hypothetical protein